MVRGVQAQPANSGDHDKQFIVFAKQQLSWRRMRKRGGRAPRAGKESEVPARVVASRYALALKRRNQRLRSDAWVKAAGFNEGNPSHSPSKTKAWAPPASPTNQKAQRVEKSKLHSMPRPPFPGRITPSSVNECGQLVNFHRDSPLLVKLGPSHQRILPIEDTNSSNSDWCGRYEDDESGQAWMPCQRIADNLGGLLQGVDYQLRVIEARGRNILRHQEQHAQGQMLVSWEMLQSKLDQVQEASLRLNLQCHAKDRPEIMSEPSADIPKKLLYRLASISEVLSPLEIALNQLSCPGLTWSALQLQHDMEALALELDHLLGLVEASGSGCTVQTDQKLDSTLLQTARLVKELGVEIKARVTNVNDNI